MKSKCQAKNGKKRDFFFFFDKRKWNDSDLGIAKI